MASAKPSDKAGVEPALTSRRGRGHGQARSAPSQHLTREDICLYLFEEGLTAEQVHETKQYFDTLEIAQLTEYFKVSAERRIEPLTHILATARKRKIKARTPGQQVCHMLSPRRLHDCNQHWHL